MKISELSWVGWLNVILIQWFFVRLAYTCNEETQRKENFSILRWVVPCTGWGSDYIWSGKAKDLECKKEITGTIRIKFTQLEYTCWSERLLKNTGKSVDAEKISHQGGYVWVSMTPAEFEELKADTAAEPNTCNHVVTGIDDEGDLVR